MNNINKSRYAILGSIFENPRSGYEIRKILLNKTGHFWQESDASIYPMLKKLEKEGKVKYRSEYVGKRERRIFEITKTGKKEFAEWINLDPEKARHRDEFLLKLFFGATTKKKEILKHLYNKLERSRDLKTKYKDIETQVLSRVPNKHPHKIFWEMTLKNGVTHTNTEIEWLQDCIKNLENK